MTLERSWKMYVADELFYAAQGKSHALRWSEIITPAPEDTRTGEEIVEKMLTGLQNMGE